MQKAVIHFRRHGESGNIYWLIGAAQVELHKQQRITDYNTMRDRILSGADSYEEALAIIREYVDLIDDDGRY